MLPPRTVSGAHLRSSIRGRGGGRRVTGLVGATNPDPAPQRSEARRDSPALGPPMPGARGPGRPPSRLHNDTTPGVGGGGLAFPVSKHVLAAHGLSLGTILGLYESCTLFTDPTPTRRARAGKRGLQHGLFPAGKLRPRGRGRGLPRVRPEVSRRRKAAHRPKETRDATGGGGQQQFGTRLG